MVFFTSQITYAVDPALSSRYHAHAEGELLVLLDVTPSQDMVDEGIAREVINKIQKLRKKVINPLTPACGVRKLPGPSIHKLMGIYMGRFNARCYTLVHGFCFFGLFFCRW